MSSKKDGKKGGKKDKEKDKERERMAEEEARKERERQEAQARSKHSSIQSEYWKSQAFLTPISTSLGLFAKMVCLRLTFSSLQLSRC
jgi:hypothetical protein